MISTENIGESYAKQGKAITIPTITDSLSFLSVLA